MEKMSEHINSTYLLKEAESLQNQLKSAGVESVGLVYRIKDLGRKFRVAGSQGGMLLIEPNYHKAARIYNEIILMDNVILQLDLGEMNPVYFNHNISQ